MERCVGIHESIKVCDAENLTMEIAMMLYPDGEAPRKSSQLFVRGTAKSGHKRQLQNHIKIQTKSFTNDLQTQSHKAAKNSIEDQTSHYKFKTVSNSKEEGSPKIISRGYCICVWLQ